MAALRALPATFRGHPADHLANMGDFGDLLLILPSNLPTGYKTHQQSPNRLQKLRRHFGTSVLCFRTADEWEKVLPPD